MVIADDTSFATIPPRGRPEAPRPSAPAAQEQGKTLLVLDTASDDARRLYSRLGWQLVGRVPDYALLPHGGFCDTSIFYLRLPG
jgi:hypothetical protein